MKPLYSTPIAFKPMKEDVTDIFEDPVFEYFPEPVEKAPVGWYCWEREYSDEGSIRCVPPYLVGEKCYVREAWCKSIIEGIIYKDGYDVPDAPRWRSPATMPAKYARRFVTILSCEPVRIEDVTEEDCLAVGLKKLSKDNGRTWKFGMADRDGLPGTDNTGWAWEDWKVDHREAFKVWWNKDKEWAWRVESEEEK